MRSKGHTQPEPRAAQAPDVDIAAQQLPLHTAAHAARLVQLCNRFTADLFDWMDVAVADEPAAHRVAIKIAVSDVAMALADRLLYPTYLQRPQLIPAELSSR